MKGGTIVLMSGAELRTGAWMIRGTIICLKPLRLLPTFSHACDYNPPFLAIYAKHLRGSASPSRTTRPRDLPPIHRRRRRARQGRSPRLAAPMNIEHVAINVADPVALADWYVRHLGMSVVRKVDGPPFTRFIADAAGHVVLEVYHQDAPVPDYASYHHFVFHVAFMTNDVAGVRARLVAAGATPATEITQSPDGDIMTFVRDPWGIVIQLVRRGRPLLDQSNSN